MLLLALLGLGGLAWLDKQKRDKLSLPASVPDNQTSLSDRVATVSGNQDLGPVNAVKHQALPVPVATQKLQDPGPGPATIVNPATAPVGFMVVDAGYFHPAAVVVGASQTEIEMARKRKAKDALSDATTWGVRAR